MNYLTYAVKSNYLLEIIKNGILYSLKQASIRFNCSESTIKRMLRILHEQGYPIKYCKKSQKIFYRNLRRGQNLTLSQYTFLYCLTSYFYEPELQIAILTLK
jgi:predicted DNA-binding transcriptional regulator YafY